MYNQKNVLHMIVGTADAAPATGTVQTYADLTDGQVAIVDDRNVCLTSGTFAAATKFRIMVRNGTSLLMTPWVTKSTITGAKATSYVGTTQQVTYIGSNGTTGSITAINNNDYITRIVYKNRQSTYGNKQMIKDAPFVSSGNATQLEVAQGIEDSLIANFKREPIPQIQFDLVADTALDTAYDITHNITVINGSAVINVATDLTYNTSSGTLAVGDYIRMALTNTTCALTNPVYKVIAIDTLAVTLDRPVVSATATYTDAQDSTQVIPAATALTSNWGIKCTGLSTAAYFVPQSFDPEYVEFSITPINYAVGDSITYTTPFNPGKGTYRQMAEIFAFAQGNWGKENRLGIPVPIPLTGGMAYGDTFHMLSFAYSNSTTRGIGIKEHSMGEIILALKVHVVNNNYVLDIFQADTTYFPATPCADWA